ncbi:SurA N-terminal domain-containing protein [Thermincola ferriacetica]|nr:SurA N-terminal domain-containing protein [Thermincola ferriacetica]
MLEKIKVHKKPITAICAAIVLLVTFIILDQQEVTHNGAVAKVNDTYITKADFDKQYNMILNYYQNTARKLSDKEKNGLKQEVLVQLIDKAIILEEAKKQGISVSDQEVDKLLQEKIKKPRFKETLEATKMSVDDYRDKIKYEQIRAKLYQSITKNYSYVDKPIEFTKYLNEKKKKAKIDIYEKFE